MRIVQGPRSRPAPRARRIGLVLGAGGITGIAWLVGALRALRQRTGWDPASADIIAGTSAGSVVATVLASRRDPAGLVTFAEDRAALDDAVRLATVQVPRAARAAVWPGSLALGVRGLLSTDLGRRVRSLSGFLPRGLRSTNEIRGLTHDAVSGGWPAHTELWLHACDYQTGRRVTFGAPDGPDAPLADAVAASCAVPGLYQPVDIGGTRYVDGGLWSFTNADALEGEGCDVVVCLSPFSSRQRGSVLDTALLGLLRSSASSALQRETDVLRRGGSHVVVLEPKGEDLRAMGLNPMQRRQSRAVIDVAAASVQRHLDGVDLSPLEDAARPAPPQLLAA